MIPDRPSKGRKSPANTEGGALGPYIRTSRQRVQLEFTPEALDRLRQIKELANASTNAEVVRNALRVYEWFLKQKAEEYKFQIVKDNQVKEVELVL